jgi:acyl-CoA thioesterase
MTHTPGPNTPATGKTLPEIIAEFNESEFARLLGMTITDAHDGYARVTMDCAGKMNPSGVAHGGAIFALADHAFGIASNCGSMHRVAISVSIQYLVPATGTLVAEARQVSDNGKYASFRVIVYAGERPVATFDGIALSLSP